MTTPSVSARRLAALLWPRRWLLAAFVVVAALASAVYALTREEQFESNAVLAQSKDEAGQLGATLAQETLLLPMSAIEARLASARDQNQAP